MTDEMQTRNVEWEQAGDLVAYLMHLAEATPHFADATSEDKAIARHIEDTLLEQSWVYIDEDDGSSLAPEWADKPTPFTLAASDWAFMERWFSNPERMGQWAMSVIGSARFE